MRASGRTQHNSEHRLAIFHVRRAKIFRNRLADVREGFTVTQRARFHFRAIHQHRNVLTSVVSTGRVGSQPWSAVRIRMSSSPTSSISSGRRRSNSSGQPHNPPRRDGGPEESKSTKLVKTMVLSPASFISLTVASNSASSRWLSPFGNTAVGVDIGDFTHGNHVTAFLINQFLQHGRCRWLNGGRDGYRYAGSYPLCRR